MRVFIKKLRYIRKNQGGFSLIELMAAIAISGVIIIGLVTTIFQLYTGHARSSGEMTVVRQVQQAGYYISRDAHMTRTDEDELIIGDDPATTEVEVVTFTWYWFKWHDNPADRDGDGLRVIYTLEGDKLYRNYERFPENDWVDPEDPDYGTVTFGDLPYEYKTFITEYIEDINCTYDGVTLTLTVTASIDSIAGEQEETRTYEAKPRPNVF